MICQAACKISWRSEPTSLRTSNTALFDSFPPLWPYEIIFFCYGHAEMKLISRKPRIFKNLFMQGKGWLWATIFKSSEIANLIHIVGLFQDKRIWEQLSRTLCFTGFEFPALFPVATSREEKGVIFESRKKIVFLKVIISSDLYLCFLLGLDHICYDTWIITKTVTRFIQICP